MADNEDSGMVAEAVAPAQKTAPSPETQASAEGQAPGEAVVAAKPAPKRRRRRTKAEMEAARAAEAAARAAKEDEGASQADFPQAEPRQVGTQADGATPQQPLPGVDELTRITQEATQASSEPTPMPPTTLADDATPKDAQAPGRRRGRHPKGQGAQQGGQGNTNNAGQGNNGGQPGQQRHQFQGGSGQGRRNRNRGAGQTSQEPSLTRDELLGMKVAELRAKAAELEVESQGLRKADLVEAVYKAAALAEGFRPVDGILEIGNEGYGWIRTGNYMKGDNDAFVHQQLIRSYGLRAGDRVAGTVGPGRSGNKYPPLQSVSQVNGREADKDALRARPRFRDLTPIFPNERLTMEHGKDSITGRAIDLVAPVGKGQRGLIVSPPKAGKTTVLKHICQSITANNPEVRLFCLLVDERPEEVTDMRRSIKGEVIASTFDMPAENHTAVAELCIEHAKRLVEEGEDVVVVLDSITRLARAYNLAQPASGRILSGGVDSAALYPPKRFLGAARNIEGGGSLTILASALVDTGSKMDEVIFEEFKGTGNMELKLDRDLADRRIFPAIDPVASGTRNEELLLDPELTPLIWGIRRVLANMNNTERAATALVRGLQATRTNEEFLIRSAKKAQQQDYSL